MVLNSTAEAAFSLCPHSYTPWKKGVHNSYRNIFIDVFFFQPVSKALLNTRVHNLLIFNDKCRFQSIPLYTDTRSIKNNHHCVDPPCRLLFFAFIAMTTEQRKKKQANIITNKRIPRFSVVTICINLFRFTFIICC